MNGSTSEDRANGGRNPTPGNPLPSPPRPIWHAFTQRNPSFVPPGNSHEPYLRTNIPPIHAQPYTYQVSDPNVLGAQTLIIQQTGAGAVYYEGARYEDRVVPQAVRDMATRDPGSERERAQSRSGHRDRSAERRSRRREGESERDRHRRRRDRHRRDTVGLDDESLVESTAPAGGQPPMGNALGIHPGSHYTDQGLFATGAPPVAGAIHPNDPYPSTSRIGGAPSTSHGIAPALLTTVSVSGSRHRDVPLSAGPETSRAPRTDQNPRWPDPVSRHSSTPAGHLLAPWAAPDLSNPSLNSLGLSAPPQNDGRPNLQVFPAVPMRLTARDSVSSWGTEDSGPTQGDVFSSLRPLAPAPADGGPLASDLLPRPEGQLLGVVSANSPISTTLYSCLRRVVQTKLQTHDLSMHRRRCSHSSPETQTPARAPATRTIRALGLFRAHKHRSSPTVRDHNRFRPRIADFLTLQSPHHRPSQFLLPPGRLLAPLLPGPHRTPCHWSHLSLTSRPQYQPPRSHACHNIHNSPSHMAVLPHCRQTLALAIAHITKAFNLPGLMTLEREITSSPDIDGNFFLDKRCSAAYT